MKSNTVFELTGNSGCKVEVIDKSGFVFVRKTSPEKKYNNRLESQKIKHDNFKKTNINAPNIYEAGFLTSGKYYYDMEFIRGINLNESLASITPSEMELIAFTLVDFMNSRDDYNQNHWEFPLTFADKVFQRNFELMRNIDKEFQEIIARIPWESIPYGICHGDLSLENILIQNKSIYLIDFHDIYFESAFQDISKIDLDLDIGWSDRRAANKIKGNFQINKLILRQAIQSRIKPEESLQVSGLKLVHLLRMVPYAINSVDSNLILNGISRTMSELRSSL